MSVIIIPLKFISNFMGILVKFTVFTKSEFIHKRMFSVILYIMYRYDKYSKWYWTILLYVQISFMHKNKNSLFPSSFLAKIKHIINIQNSWKTIFFYCTCSYVELCFIFYNVCFITSRTSLVSKLFFIQLEKCLERELIIVNVH